ncbi:hypothetical protein D3C87_124640 [compost metagenome]
MKIFLTLALASIIALPAWSSSSPTMPDPTTPQDQLEVTISDSPATEGHRRYTYNFGNVRVNWSQWAYINLRNTGYSTIRVYHVNIYGSGFSGWSSCPYYLHGGQVCSTRVEFRPWSRGYYSGRLDYILSSGNIYVDLYGWGVW